MTKTTVVFNDVRSAGTAYAEIPVFTCLIATGKDCKAWI